MTLQLIVLHRDWLKILVAEDSRNAILVLKQTKINLTFYDQAALNHNNTMAMKSILTKKKYR